MGRTCESCLDLQEKLAGSRERIAVLEDERADLQARLTQAKDLIELQRGDIERYRAAYEQVKPNTPERVPKDQLQLAFVQVLQSMQDVPAARDLANKAANDDSEKKLRTRKSPKQDGRNPHGRRKLDLENLPVKNVVIDPDEVVAADGEGFELVAEEVSDRIAHSPATYVRLRITRRKWARKSQVENPDTAKAMVIAPVPPSVWPSFMADPSAVAANIVAKYDDYLPLHRQEKISNRQGFRVPRSTQCGWLGEAYKVLYRIVDAMHAEAIANSFCIATDATGAPVLAPDGCEKWHIFVFIADRDHVIFKYTEEHTSESVQGMLDGFKGYLLADAAPVYDVVFRNGAFESGCWFHLRRYFWRGLPTDKLRALEIMSLIAKLFEIDAECKHLPLEQKTARRAMRSQPVLDVIDAWVERNRNEVDARGPLDKGIGYYLNQREALHRFLKDGRLRLDNSISEQQLRNAVLGRHNWTFFNNETGLKWYTTFRSLLASCRMHDINVGHYMEQVLRLAPHWPVSRVLELAPKYWRQTVANFSDQHQKIIVPPWEREWPTVQPTAPPKAAANSG